MIRREAPDARVEINTEEAGGLTRVEASSRESLPSARHLFTSSPKLVTLDCTGTLLQLTTDVGMFYRETLFKLTEYNARLPRPSVFSEAFFNAYKKQEESHPCFGCGSNMSSEDWWRTVVTSTYLNVKNLDYEPGLRDELESGLGEACFQELYNEVFMSEEGWELKPGVKEALEAIKEWKGEEGGPKMIGAISNFDERLHGILKALEVEGYFDFVITSREVGAEKPDQKVFDIATTKASSTPAESVHVGDSYSKDVVGAAKAGWHPVFVPSAASSVVSSPHSDSSGGSGVEYTQVGDLFGFLAIYGREPKVRVVPTTRPVMENGNDGMATHEWE
ncbi:hypothetical protein TrVE_jg3955 [Triparma verrucosa]|uniref:Haloacid dehalogenase-like hydrolase domain-containing protein 3 n=2 Tax=Triparma TaxID=722752 RepID=A0A9W7AHH5_9STRA|nr:hypothetical protein TrST_g9111 [Triparma strigata]GMH86482.1 hypothetical protein TrVE_jg3955 [Triparma verrucosa]